MTVDDADRDGTGQAPRVARHAPAPRTRAEAASTMRARSTVMPQTKTVPTRAEMRSAARTVRKIVERTANLPDDTPADERLRDRLELAAAVLERAGEKSST